MTRTQRSIFGRLFWSLVVILGMVTVSVRFVPEPKLPQSSPQVEQVIWSLPSMGNYNLDRAYKDILRLKPWGDERKGAQGGTGSGEWRLRGVVRTSEDRFALIEADRKIRRYMVGETLPGGETLQAIHDDYIEIKDIEGNRIIRMYR